MLGVFDVGKSVSVRFITAGKKMTPIFPPP
jgi:hypothetical protein